MKTIITAAALTLMAGSAMAGWDHGPQAPVGGPGYGEGASQENDIHGDQHSGDELDRGGENDHENDMNANFGW